MRGDITGLVLVGLLLAGIGAETQAPVDKWFDSNGLRLRYVEAGTGVPVVLVHGYTRSLESNWIVPGVFADLSKDHRVIAYDMPGHGKSEKAHEPSACRDMATDPIRLLDHLGIKRAHLVGYSMGGGLVAKVAVTHPERFITAILGGHTGYREWEPGDEKYYEDSARELETDVPFRSLVSSPGLTGSKPTEEQIRALSASLAAENDVKALAALRRGGMKDLFMTRAQAASIKVPMLMIIGTLDDVADGKAMQAILPSARLVTIDGAAHGGERGAVRRPEFLAAVRQFIAGHR
jgi:pimeloyl-ACP methyl ester carboxylesterase